MEHTSFAALIVALHNITGFIQDNTSGAHLHEYMAEEHEKLVETLLERDAEIEHLTDENRNLIDLKNGLECSLQACTESLQKAVGYSDKFYC